MRPLLAILFCLAGWPLAAGQILSAEEFDSYTRGKTLFYGADGEPYGAERYLDDRRVVWSFLDGNCEKGTWYEDQGMICFVYQDRPDPQCWTFEKRQSGLVARFRNDPAETTLYEADDLGEEMVCYGPDVGA